MKKWECTVCGYIHEGEEPPDECPICSADKSMFVEVIEETKPPAEDTAAPTPVSAPTGGKTTPLSRGYALAQQVIVDYHLHPIAVHTPNGILPMALIFLFITALLGFPLFETAALYSFVFVLIAMPVVLFTGYEVWQQRYRGAMTSIFKVKIGAAIISTLLLCILVIWRVMNPHILTTASTGRWIYLLLSVVLIGSVGIAGHMGGKLVFGGRKE